jgi:hypothetical protein
MPKTLSGMEEHLDNLLEITKQEAIVDREAPASRYQQDIVQHHTELPDNTVSPKTIENYLKDLMAIPRPQVDNSELLDGIDRVSDSITDCINLVESALRKKKSRINQEKTSPQIECTGDIFLGLDHIDEKITQCIKVVEDTLNSKKIRRAGVFRVCQPLGIKMVISRTRPSIH